MVIVIVVTEKKKKERKKRLRTLFGESVPKDAKQRHTSLSGFPSVFTISS